MKIPKIIWMYWHNGIENAPPLVQICSESWQRKNKEWRLCVLDNSKINDLIDVSEIMIKNPMLTVQAFSDIVRWKILHYYGGVWADATLFCNRPLSDWISGAYSSNGFFAFKADNNQFYHSWFLCGHSDNVIVQVMNAEIDRFFLLFGGYRHYWDIKGFWRIFYFIERNAGSYNSKIWRSYVFRRFFKAAPYFWVMYLMGGALNRSPEARAEFESIGIPFGEMPHALQSMTSATATPTLDEVRTLLEGGCPVQKLTTKRFVQQWTDAGIIDLLDRHARQ